MQALADDCFGVVLDGQHVWRRLREEHQDEPEHREPHAEREVGPKRKRPSVCAPTQITPKPMIATPARHGVSGS